MSPPNKIGNWSQMAQYVVHELDRHSDILCELNNKVDRLLERTAVNSVRIGLLGAIGGCVPMIVGVVWYILTHGK